MTSSVYDPAQIEEKWRAKWAELQAASPSLPEDAPPFCMVMPPPNVTGSLHIGHALNNTLQDILARWRRMSGDRVFWIPGTDHAGIATQNVVERKLLAESKTHRQDLGRARFMDAVWAWKKESGDRIIGQLKRLGASCQWNEERFTMDAGFSRAVAEAFVRLYQDGLIYRAERLIHWCMRCQTALSDIEVEHEEISGELYHIDYPLDDARGGLTVATTRPETLLADMAVAVHPEDERYRTLIGRTVRLPLTERQLPIVGDAILVDRAFGTGVVKITPGHDFNDEQAGRRHGLENLCLWGKSGTIRAEALARARVVPPEFAASLLDQPIKAIRARVLLRLSETGIPVTTHTHCHTVGKCYRCRSVVEPLLSTQWFVRMQDTQCSLAAPAIAAVQEQRICLIPKEWEANFFGWMNQMQDWCISRQLWWGHAIPAWYCPRPHCSRNQQPVVGLAKPASCPACGTAVEADPDVLDTWFSSALWPLGTLGWPSELQPSEASRQLAAQRLKAFYPTSVLVTSFDILFFWVARMMMMGLYFMKEVPFKTVYLHALVRDAEGQKMSKSKGNVVDPLAVIETYGTDALRFTLAAMASPGRDIRMAEERIAGYRNFANKIWNAGRFVLMSLPTQPHPRGGYLPSAADLWMGQHLQDAVAEVNRKLTDYRFDEAAMGLYHFAWHTFCDWHVELAKVDLKQSDRAEAARYTLLETFRILLQLLHPFMPFLTAELWQSLGEATPIETSTYPASLGFYFPHFRSVDRIPERIADFQDGVIEPVLAIRNMRGEMNLPTGGSALLRRRAEHPLQEVAMKQDEQTRYLLSLARLSHLDWDGLPPRLHISAFTSSFDIYIPISEEMQSREIARLRAEQARIEKALTPILQKTAGPDFVKAPPSVQEKQHARILELTEQQRQTGERLQRFEADRG